MALGSQDALVAPSGIERIGSDTSKVVGLKLVGVPALLFVADKTSSDSIELDTAEIKSDSCLLFLANREVAEAFSLQSADRQNPVPLRAGRGWVELDLSNTADRKMWVKFKPL